jgi:signal transduction histidine kinase
VRHEAVDLATTVREVLDRDPWRRYASRIEVDLPEALSVTGDRGAITRILSSLLDNAVKHTAGRISVQVLARGDAAVMEVADRGPGMAQRDLERIFERFTRLGDHLHRVQGPGLGLAIARAYASELGGELTVRSDVATGSVFSLRLPLASVRAVERMNDAELAG